MALMSGPIAVADATQWSFAFPNFRTSVNVQVRFYSDAAGNTEITPGTGSRDITATNVFSAYEGNPTRSTARKRDMEAAINNGTVSGAADGTWYEISLGSGLGQVTIAAAVDVNPGGAVTYRIFVAADGSSAEA